MGVPDLSRQPYRRPPLNRATDPQRMNWLWRLICETAELDMTELLEALHAAQIPIDLSRMRRWSVSDRDDTFFPMSIAEIERNLRMLVALRKAKKNGPAAPAEVPAHARKEEPVVDPAMTSGDEAAVSSNVVMASAAPAATAADGTPMPV